MLTLLNRICYVGSCTKTAVESGLTGISENPKDWGKYPHVSNSDISKCFGNSLVLWNSIMHGMYINRKNTY